jgi:type IV secretory pathway TrbF-like protein
LDSTGLHFVKASDTSAAARAPHAASTRRWLPGSVDGTFTYRRTTSNIVGVSADAAGAAQNVKTASETLGAQTQQLRSQVDDFLGQIRVA